jgi:hypothetical protein
MTRWTSISPDDARERARRILEDDDFRPEGPASEPPRPLKQPLTWLGERLSDIFELIRAWTARVKARRKHAADDDQDLDALIRKLTDEAEAAAAAGRWAEAMRLRFRIGLLRLEVGGAIRKVDHKPNGEVTAEVQSERLLDLAQLHDRVAYGRRTADEHIHDHIRVGMTDVEAALTGGKTDR